MTLRTAIIANTGFDGGGSSKLGYEYDKIGMDVYFRNVVQPNQYRPKQEYKTYDTVEELIQILKNYEKAIFLPLVINKTVLEDSFFLPRLREEIPNLKICFLNCSRSDKYFRKVLECCEHTNFEFDWVYSIAPLTECGYEKYTLFNINAYTFLDEPIYTGEKPIVFTAGRVEGIKGTLRYINSITSDFLNGPFCYIHEGANFTWSKSGNVSCTPQLLSFFNLIDGKKECKELFTFKSYGDEPEKGKLSIYPSYQVDDIFDKWKYYYCGVCCILGSKSKPYCSVISLTRAVTDFISYFSSSLRPKTTFCAAENTSISLKC